MRVTLQGGGFHNVKALSLNIPKSRIAFSEGVAALSENQIRKVKRHYCGVKGCRCNSAPLDSFAEVVYLP